MSAESLDLGPEACPVTQEDKEQFPHDDICLGCPGFDETDVTEATRACHYFNSQVDTLDGEAVRFTSYSCTNPQVLGLGEFKTGYVLQEKLELPK